MGAELVLINVVCSYLSEHPGGHQKIRHKRVFEFNAKFYAKFSVVVTDGEINHI